MNYAKEIFQAAESLEERGKIKHLMLSLKNN